MNTAPCKPQRPHWCLTPATQPPHPPAAPTPSPGRTPAAGRAAQRDAWTPEGAGSSGRRSAGWQRQRCRSTASAQQRRALASSRLASSSRSAAWRVRRCARCSRPRRPRGRGLLQRGQRGQPLCGSLQVCATQRQAWGRRSARTRQPQCTAGRWAARFAAAPPPAPAAAWPPAPPGARTDPAPRLLAGGRARGAAISSGGALGAACPRCCLLLLVESAHSSL